MLLSGEASWDWMWNGGGASVGTWDSLKGGGGVGIRSGTKGRDFSFTEPEAIAKRYKYNRKGR